MRYKYQDPLTIRVPEDIYYMKDGHLCIAKESVLTPINGLSGAEVGFMYAHILDDSDTALSRTAMALAQHKLTIYEYAVALHAKYALDYTNPREDRTLLTSDLQWTFRNTLKVLEGDDFTAFIASYIPNEIIRNVPALSDAVNYLFVHYQSSPEASDRTNKILAEWASKIIDANKRNPLFDGPDEGADFEENTTVH